MMGKMFVVALAVACSNNGADSTVGESESDTDTDTDTDSDTDTDTDTDADLWDADVLTVDAWFGYDADAGQIVQGIVDGKPQQNLILATIANHANLMTGSPTQYCFVGWEIPDGGLAPNDAFDNSYWLSFDLSEAKVTLWDDGDCDHLGSFWGTPRGSKDVAEFAAEFGMGFGVKPISAVDPASLAEWEEVWSDGQDESWDDAYTTFAGGAFTILGEPPDDADIMLALEMDPKTHEVEVDFQAGTGNYLDLATSGFAPTGWYVSLVMYAYSK
jgi:hypothetical protein